MNPTSRSRYRALPAGIALALALAAGFLAGRGTMPSAADRNRAEEPSGAIPRAKTSERVPHAPSGKDLMPESGPETINDWRDSPLDPVDKEERMRAEFAAMTVDEFAQELAGIIGCLEYNPEFLERKAAMLRFMDGDRALATYFEFKRSHNIPVSAWNGNMMSLLLRAGMLDGKGSVERLLKESPGGVGEIGPFMHGWAKADPAGAIEWLNGTDGDLPGEKHFIHGLFYGLAEDHTEFAFEAFNALDPEAFDREQILNASSAITASLMASRSVAEAARFVESLPEDMRTNSIEMCGWAFERCPPSEMVTWLADYAGESGSIQSSLQGQLRNWAGLEPEAALQWASAQATTDGSPNPAQAYFSAVATQIDPAMLSSWLARHPDHPDSVIARAILDGTR